MRATQREALRLFRERGFAHVTVEEIAGNLDMAASTIFRHFGTKEAIVLWDEHDAALDDALSQRFSRQTQNQSPFQALRDSFVDTLAQRYQTDLDFQLDRIGFIYQTEALHAAAVEAQFKDRDELTAALSHLLSREHREAALLLAGAAMLALDVAIERWQERSGHDDLAQLIYEAFTTLENLSTLRWAA
jgi:AcrR family transcriptional regulator